MAKLAGAALKLFQTFLYALTFCCAGIIVGLYSYFLAVQSDRDVQIPAWEKAVVGMSGAACLYAAFAVILTCCLGGITLFAFLGIVLDILFAAALIAVAVLTRDAVRSCSANIVYTPLGIGPPDSRDGWGNHEETYSVHLGLACRYNKAAFSVAIVGAVIFLVAALIQLFLGRHHQREKRYGPSPSNNYTSGSGRFWRRRTGPKTTYAARDAEMAPATGALATERHDIRPSHETGFTGSTVAPATAVYDAHGKPVTSASPYGYDKIRNTAANY